MAAHQIEAWSFTSTLPMREAFGATNVPPPTLGRWSWMFMTERCLQIRSWKIQLSCARQPIRSSACPVSRKPRPTPTTTRRIKVLEGAVSVSFDVRAESFMDLPTGTAGFAGCPGPYGGDFEEDLLGKGGEAARVEVDLLGRESEHIARLDRRAGRLPSHASIERF